MTNLNFLYFIVLSSYSHELIHTHSCATSCATSSQALGFSSPLTERASVFLKMSTEMPSIKQARVCVYVCVCICVYVCVCVCYWHGIRELERESERKFSEKRFYFNRSLSLSLSPSITHTSPLLPQVWAKLFVSLLDGLVSESFPLTIELTHQLMEVYPEVLSHSFTLIHTHSLTFSHIHRHAHKHTNTNTQTQTHAYMMYTLKHTNTRIYEAHTHGMIKCLSVCVSLDDHWIFVSLSRRHSAIL